VVMVGKIAHCEACDNWHTRIASGFVIGREGIIVTNRHVVDKDERAAAIGVQTWDGRLLPIRKILAVDKPNDLAVLQVDADDLVALHEAGVSEEAMVRMIQLGAAAPAESVPPAAAAPAPAPITTSKAVVAPVTEASEPISVDPSGRIEVILKRDFRITFFEVAIDGETSASSGRLWEGASEPGMMLRRPGRVRKDNTFTALDLAVEPGSYEVAVGFAVSVVEDDPDLNDEWGKFTVERYVNRGVRAMESPEDPAEGEWGTPAAINCTVAAGKTCTVTATLERRAPTRLGGIPVYSVSYTVD